MKKFIIIFTFAFLPLISLATYDCPYKEINCEHPGKCTGYTDTDNNKICDHSEIVSNKIITKTEEITHNQINENKNSSPNKRTYPLIPITLISVLLYTLTYFLAKKKILTTSQHLKIWNLVLLISFSISALLGVFLIIKINFELTMNPLFNVLYWHVNFGVIMAVISTFHIARHWKYFKNIFK